MRDLIGRRYDEGDVVSVAPGDTLLTAFNRMRASDLAQLPVIDSGQLVGILDESDLLLHVSGDAAHFAGAGGRHHDDADRNPGALKRLARPARHPGPGLDGRRRRRLPPSMA